MSRVVLVNGISTHGESNVDRLKAPLADRGIEVVDVPLPKRWVVTARWGGPEDAQTIYDYSRDGDILVCHSFGVLRGWYAHQLRPYSAIFAIAGAISKDVEWRYPGRVICYYSRDDLALKAGAILLLHPFGRAGLSGFTQPGVTNVPCHGAGHGDYFYGRRLIQLADHIKQVRDLLGSAPNVGQAA